MATKKAVKKEEIKEELSPPSQGNYKVENVILIESVFTREINIDLKAGEITNETNIDSQANESTSEGKFVVTLQLQFKGKQADRIVCTANIKMMGIFEKNGDPAWPEENFKKINAPAIIYPFIREHLHNICLKAGIANVLLPTVNFKV